MSEFTQLKMTIDYWRSRWQVPRRDERGVSAPEYLVLLLGILAIAALAIVAVRTFVTNKGNELNSGN